jgi:hypothetical protein
MDALEPAQRGPHLANANALFNDVSEIHELDNGYAFCFGSETKVLERLGQFIALERLCCPFFGFTVDVEPEGGQIWLRLTGRDGVKPFIRAELGELIGSSLHF